MVKKYPLPLSVAALALAVTPIATQAQVAELSPPAEIAQVMPDGIVDATPDDLEAVRGGGYWIVIAVGGKLAIRYCTKNKTKCAVGAYKVYSSYTKAVEYARSRGWIK